MKNKKLSESLDRSMADVSWKEQNRLRVWNGIRNAEPARSRAPRRISVVIAFALVLVLGMASLIFIIFWKMNILSLKIKQQVI